MEECLSGQDWDDRAMFDLKQRIPALAKDLAAKIYSKISSNSFGLYVCHILKRGRIKSWFSIDHGSDLWHRFSRRIARFMLLDHSFQLQNWVEMLYLSSCNRLFSLWRDNLVGKGGYSKVYKGSLPDGQLIAVKQRTKGNSEEQGERDFLTELGILGHISHPNTTALLGFCIEYVRYLIFDYLPHGSLSDLLHGLKAQLFNWHLRFKVAVGVARGLHYLHEKCQRRIIHRDIKTSNILLGIEFEPQILALPNGYLDNGLII